VLSDTEISSEDVLRADVYRLLAVLLRAAPDQANLDMLATMRGDQTPLGQAVGRLATLASKSSRGSIDLEYHALFIGVEEGEVHPYGSYYMKDFLHESPLDRLRSDMSRVGIGMRDSVSEPEDHIAALCEMMAGMILGDFTRPVSLPEQKIFFKTHISAWAGQFFKDLQIARSSVFYTGVGGIGAAFIDIEEAAFDMV
jgi:TorA maturation chaperone TorD